MISLKIDRLKISIAVNLLLLFVILILQLFTHTLSIFPIPEIVLNIITLLIVSLVFTFLTITYLLIRLQILKPIKALTEAQNLLINNDLKLFNVAISELARGNITIKIQDLKAKPLDNGRNGYLNVLIEQYNKILKNILESINDYNSIASISCKRICYVGADSYLEGEICGEILGNLIGSQGKVAILLHSFKRSGHILRRKGFISILTSKFPLIEIMETLEEYEDKEKTYNLTKELITKYPDLKGIYITEGSTPWAAAKAVKDAGKEGKIRIVTHDITKETVQYLKLGIISATLSQNPYIQGYNPVIHLYNYLATKEKPLVARLLTNLEEVNINNYLKYWGVDSGEILSEKAQHTLAKPVQNNKNQPFKIAMLLPDDKIFWEPVFKGASKAAEILKKYSTIVDIIIPEQMRSGDSSTKAFSDLLNSLSAKQYQAIALPLFDKDLISSINKFTEDGIAFATYNAEPLSFRGMFNTLLGNTQHLFQVSENIAAAATESGQAATRINNTMQLINNSITNQMKQLSETEQQINSLFSLVNEITNKSSESYVTADNTQQSATEGSKIAEDSNRAISQTLESTLAANEIIKTLGENTIKIKEIVALINDIAVRTNLIAINASILAAKAGKEGKGFSVVANEIIQLAENSARCSEDIKTIIDTILANINGATEIISNGMVDINKSSSLVQIAFERLNNIVKYSTENKNNIEEIVNEVNKMKSASENVQHALGILDEINSKNTEAIEEITNSIQEISKQIIENSKSVQSLIAMAQCQKDLLAQFSFEE
jgi:methyl-accepting chemotaxis protein